MRPPQAPAGGRYVLNLSGGDVFCAFNLCLHYGKHSTQTISDILPKSGPNQMPVQGVKVCSSSGRVRHKHFGHREEVEGALVAVAGAKSKVDSKQRGRSWPGAAAAAAAQAAARPPAAPAPDNAYKCSECPYEGKSKFHFIGHQKRIHLKVKDQVCQWPRYDHRPPRRPSPPQSCRLN